MSNKAAKTTFPKLLTLVGPAGSGKGTLAHLLHQQARQHGKNLLWIEARPAIKIQTPDHGQAAEGRSFAETILALQNRAVLQNDDIEWACHALLQPQDETTDRLYVGQLPQAWPPGLEKHARYGLSRLMQAYDQVLIVGYQPALWAVLSSEKRLLEAMQLLVVLQPVVLQPLEQASIEQAYEHADWWQAVENAGQTPGLILNRLSGASGGSYAAAGATMITGQNDFRAWLDTQLNEGKLKLVGRFPEFPTPAILWQQLPALFVNSLQRLNWGPSAL